MNDSDLRSRFLRATEDIQPHDRLQDISDDAPTAAIPRRPAALVAALVFALAVGAASVAMLGTRDTEDRQIRTRDGSTTAVEPASTTIRPIGPQVDPTPGTGTDLFDVLRHRFYPTVVGLSGGPDGRRIFAVTADAPLDDIRAAIDEFDRTLTCCPTPPATFQLVANDRGRLENLFEQAKAIDDPTLAIHGFGIDAVTGTLDVGLGRNTAALRARVRHALHARLGELTFHSQGIASALPASSATIAGTGREGTAPPCANGPEGRAGADVHHPERAPLQAERTFTSVRVRWAFCGASIAYSPKLLSLRSTDGGRTWLVVDLAFGLNPHHAGDRISVTFDGSNQATIRIVSPTVDRDDRYRVNGGGGWRILPRR